MAYRHGVYITEKPTALVSPVNVESAMPVIIGTAPVHNLPEGQAVPVNEPKLVYSFPDFVSIFGAPKSDENVEDFTLYQAAQIYFTRYKCAPIVFVNVFDPAVHVKETTATTPDEGETETPGQENPGGEDVPSTQASDAPVPDVSKVNATDIIGGVDPTTLKRTGISLVDEVFPRFRITPGQILAPKYSKIPAVAIAIGAATTSISGFFRCIGICECADDLENYTAAPAWLNDNNLTDENLVCMYGDCLYNGHTEPGSIHLAGVIAARDAENSGVPFWSPSNKRFEAEGMTLGGKEIHLTPAEAEYLNGNGLVVGLNMIGGLVAWGDQTCAYPGNTDPKDSSIPIRRMFSWIGNTLVLTGWQFVSTPIRRRMIETIQDVFNCWLNGLTGREFLLGGRCTFEKPDNPVTDLMSGIVRWHIYICPPQAAHEIEFILEYDPAYLETLFG